MKRYDDKRAWVREHLADICSMAELVSNVAKAFSTKESKASDELKQILEDEREIESEHAESSAQQHYALGQRLLATMLTDKAHGPAAQVWKTMQSLKGLDQPQQLEVNVTSAPSAETVRARIGALLASQRVREEAEKINVDVDALASDKPMDGLSPAKLLARQTSQASAPSDANTPSEPDALSDDAGPDNLAASLVSALLPKDR